MNDREFAAAHNRYLDPPDDAPDPAEHVYELAWDWHRIELTDEEVESIVDKVDDGEYRSAVDGFIRGMDREEFYSRLEHDFIKDDAKLLDKVNNRLQFLINTEHMHGCTIYTYCEPEGESVPNAYAQAVADGLAKSANYPNRWPWCKAIVEAQDKDNLDIRGKCAIGTAHFRHRDDFIACSRFVTMVNNAVLNLEKARAEYAKVIASGKPVE